MVMRVVGPLLFLGNIKAVAEGNARKTTTVNPQILNIIIK